MDSAVAHPEQLTPTPGNGGASRALLKGSARTKVSGWGLLLVPACVFLIVFFFVPVFYMAWRSFTDPGPENYAKFVETSTYIRVLWVTIRTSLIVTAATLLLGYPYAYMMNIAGKKLRLVLIGAVLLPYWSSVLVRTYAWTVLLQDTGVINSLLKSLGLITDSLPLMRNDLGVTLGMTQILLPLMVFPIFAVMRKIDTDLLPAAESLGARPWRAFMRIFLPLSFPGIFAGSLLVFICALGYYITPALLGSPSNTMFSVLVAHVIQHQCKFGLGSALGVILLIVTLLLLWIGARFVKIGELFGYSREQ